MCFRQRCRYDTLLNAIKRSPEVTCSPAGDGTRRHTPGSFLSTTVTDQVRRHYQTPVSRCSATMDYHCVHKSRQPSHVVRGRSSAHFTRRFMLTVAVALLGVNHIDVVGSTSALDFGGGRYAPRCEPIKLSMCTDMRYNMTQMPNFAGELCFREGIFFVTFYLHSHSLPLCLSFTIFKSRCLFIYTFAKDYV